MRRESSLIEANIATRVYLIRIVPELRSNEMHLQRLETSRVLIRYGFNESSSVLDPVFLFVCLLSFYCKLNRVISCLLI